MLTSHTFTLMFTCTFHSVLGPFVQHGSVLLEMYRHKATRLLRDIADLVSSGFRRPSGIPSEDFNTAAILDAEKLVPELEKQYAEVCSCQQ